MEANGTSAKGRSSKSTAMKNKVKYEKILFPTDFTAASNAAAEYALMMARQHKARLYVLHVIDTSKEAAGFYVPHLSYEYMDSEVRSSASEMLKRFCAGNFKGYKNIELRVLAGVPYQEILKVVRGNRIGLVVMGTFGKTGLDRLLLGSTTEKVMRKIKCPLLIIPPRK